MTPQYINKSLFFLIQIGRWAEDLGMSAKEICEVLTNNRGYYKEVFDYWLPMKRKIIALYKQSNSSYVPNDSKVDPNMLAGLFGGKK